MNPEPMMSLEEIGEIEAPGVAWCTEAQFALLCATARKAHELTAERDRLAAEVERLEEQLIAREARRLEIIDWLQEEIGTAWCCDRCGRDTYHAFSNECADCGAPFPLPHILAFKLHAAITGNEEYVTDARQALKGGA